MKNYYSISLYTNTIPSQIIKRLIFTVVFFIIGILPQQTRAYTALQSSSPVTVYQNCDLSGWGIDLQVGYYTLSELMALGITDDDISSIQIQDGYQIDLYSQDNFTGEISRINSYNDGCLTNNTFDNITSSLRIFSIPDPSCLNINSNFSNGSMNWNNWTNTGVTANFAVTNGEYAVTGITGTTASWHVQFFQNYNFQQGGNYTINFKARSTSPKTIGVLIRECVAGDCSTADYYTSIPLGTSMTQYSFDYTQIEPTYVYGQIIFELGENSSDIYFDDVCITKNWCKGNCMSTNENFKNKFNVSPIPASNQLEINADNIKYDMSIYSVEGKLLLEQKNLYNSNTIDIASLSNGIYILKISNGDMVMNKKIVVSK